MGQRLNYSAALEGTPGTVHVCGNFTANGGSSPTVFSSGPFTVTRTGSGALSVTLKENMSEFLSGDVQVLDVAAGTKQAFILAASISVGTNTTNASFTICTQTVAGTQGDLTGVVISFDTNWRKGALRK